MDQRDAASQHAAIDKRFKECSLRSLLSGSLATERGTLGGQRTLHFELAMHSVSAATVADEPILWQMLTYAASMDSDSAEQIALAQADSYLRTYVADWGKVAGDVGVIARDVDGLPLGAAWVRLCITDGLHEIGDARTPELAIGVVPRARGSGLGTVLLRTLMADARAHYAQIALSVRAANPAVQLYRRLGFYEVSRMTNRVGGPSLIMRVDLS